MMTLNSTSRGGSGNQILAGLGARDFSLLEPHLTLVELRVPTQLELANKRIDHVYFIESGFASVVANGSTRPMEIGMIGREGMTGLAVLMGRDRSPNETYMQLAGSGRRITVAHFARRDPAERDSASIVFAIWTRVPYSDYPNDSHQCALYDRATPGALAADGA
jgi:hypothetical protein